MLSEDQSYVVAIKYDKTHVSNLSAVNGLSAPRRNGYIFSGWTTVNGGTSAEYSMEELESVANGTTLYAVWLEE